MGSCVHYEGLDKSCLIKYTLLDVASMRCELANQRGAIPSQTLSSNDLWIFVDNHRPSIVNDIDFPRRKIMIIDDYPLIYV